MPQEREESFIANIKVDRVRRTPPQNQTGRGWTSESVAETSKREIESFKITLRAPTMEGLIEKLNKHLALVDEHDFGTDATATRV